MPQFALAWLLHRQDELGMTIIPLLGVTNSKYLEESLGALDVKLSPDEIRDAEGIAMKASVLPW